MPNQLGAVPPASARSPAWWQAVSLAAPAVAQQALVLLVNLTGRWLAGNATTVAGADQLALQAAQTTCFYLSWMIGSFGILASAGAAALVARLIGAGDQSGANRAMHQSLLLALVVAVAGWVFGWVGIETLLDALNLDGAAGRHAAEFLQVMMLLLPFQLISNTANASLAGAGDTRTPLWISLATTLANLPLAWIAFRGLGTWPGLGLTGIAWGAGLSQAIGTVTLLFVLARDRKSVV